MGTELNMIEDGERKSNTVVFRALRIGLRMKQNPRFPEETEESFNIISFKVPGSGQSHIRHHRELRKVCDLTFACKKYPSNRRE